MLWFLFIGCSIFAGLSGSPADPSDSAEIIVEVPKGATARSMGPILEKAGAINDSEAFHWFVRINKEGGCIKAGKHPVARSMSHTELIASLCDVPVVNAIPITILEGWRIREIDAALTKKGLIQAGEYAALAKTPSTFKAKYPLPTKSLEGYLYPETYMVEPERFEPQKFIQRQLNTFHERFMAKHPSGFGRRSLHDVVIMGSMIVREEPTAAQRPMVAGILWKRIDNGWNLGTMRGGADRAASGQNRRNASKGAHGWNQLGSISALEACSVEAALRRAWEPGFAGAESAIRPWTRRSKEI